MVHTNGTVGLRLARWVPRVLGVVPRRNRETEDEVWLLILSALAVLPAQLLSCLPESPYIPAYFIGCHGLFGELCEQLATYVQKMDCVYLVNWYAWLPRTGGYSPVVV